MGGCWWGWEAGWWPGPAADAPFNPPPPLSSLDWSVECELGVTFCQAAIFGPIMAVNPTMNVSGDCWLAEVEQAQSRAPTPPPTHTHAPAPHTPAQVYDITKECEGPLCYDFSVMDRYLNLPETQEELGVHKPWAACDMGVRRVGGWVGGEVGARARGFDRPHAYALAGVRGHAGRLGAQL